VNIWVFGFDLAVKPLYQFGRGDLLCRNRSPGGVDSEGIYLHCENIHHGDTEARRKTQNKLSLILRR
jgi:hypothetical protein